MDILGENLRVERAGGKEIIGIIGGKLWPERVIGYQKYGNYRRENYGRKEWSSIRSMGIIGGKTMAGKNGRV